MSKLIYSPYYFGPNAFPVPDLRSGKIGDKYEIELRYDYHHADGDQTQDVYGRLFIPFGTRAALEVNGVITEKYETSEFIRDQRHAATVSSKNGESCKGDLIAIAMFQALRSDKWMDITVTFGLKTASGNRLSDARYTDAAAYWFDTHLGKDLFINQNKDTYFRVAAMLGFYCYMTNSLTSRQNDAWMLGAGFKSRLKNVSFDADLRGFQGYLKEGGDDLLLFHTQLKYTYKKNSIYFRYQQGVHDYIYQTYSGGYIFCF